MVHKSDGKNALRDKRVHVNEETIHFGHLRMAKQSGNVDIV